MYMPGRLRTASRPSRIWMLPSPYAALTAAALLAMSARTPLSSGWSCTSLIDRHIHGSGRHSRAFPQETLLTRACARTGRSPADRRSDAHRHHHVLEAGLLGYRDQRARVGVLQLDL